MDDCELGSVTEKRGDLLRTSATQASWGTQHAQPCRSQLILEEVPELRATHCYPGPCSTSSRSVSKPSALMWTSICSKLVKIKHHLLQITSPHLASIMLTSFSPITSEERVLFLPGIHSLACACSVLWPVLCLGKSVGVVISCKSAFQ